MTTHQPIGAYATIQFKGEDTTVSGYFISFADYPAEDDQDSDRVFYYAEGEHEVKDMMTNGALDFVVIDYTLEY